MRWPVVAGEVPAPTEGSVIALTKRTDRFRDDPDEVLPTEGAVEAGAIVVEAERPPRSASKFGPR